ncbi:hypothetical protein [Hansschlegelia sp.]|uniref:hypothetical protein n=1 Tax=Hansschlegelia sp. TaxID=2041892 RepID=UPI002C2592B7|nr:hypothetical protein [Hansschlegelia sp.]HVI27284.1 hypothetical protein [Hansschlegelia sp.]
MGLAAARVGSNPTSRNLASTLLFFCSRTPTTRACFCCSFSVGDHILANMTHGNSRPQDDAKERLAELADLLAAGLLRLRLRRAEQSSGLSDDGGESSLDCVGDRSMHANPKTQGIAA